MERWFAGGVRNKVGRGALIAERLRPATEKTADADEDGLGLASFPLEEGTKARVVVAFCPGNGG